MTIQPVTPERLHEFLERLTETYRDYCTSTQHPCPAPSFVAQPGTKNIRIVCVERQYKSVYCFIEQATGNILKSAGWKAPAKGARGSIWNEDCDVGIGKPCNIFGGGLYK